MLLQSQITPLVNIIILEVQGDYTQKADVNTAGHLEVMAVAFRFVGVPSLMNVRGAGFMSSESL